MYLQTVDVARQDSVTMTGETKTYELETTGNLSWIDILVNFTADASGADFVKMILDWITSIEVIGNSTDIIVSLDARELAALIFYDLGHVVEETRTEEQDAENYAHLVIPFGRYLGDPEYALDLSKWDLVELNITNGDSDTGNFFDTGKYTIREKFLREGPPPSGYLKTYEANEWTPASTTDEKTVNVPKEHKIRQIIISVLPDYPARNAAYAKEMHEILDTIKLEYKSGNIVIFDEDTEELLRQNADEFGLAETGGVVQGDNGDYFSTDLAWVVDANLSVQQLVGGTTTQAIAGVYNLPESRLAIFENALAAGQLCNWKARGYGYMHSAVFHYDRKKDMANLLDPMEMATVRLKYTAGATNGKVRTVLQQVITG